MAEPTLKVEILFNAYSPLLAESYDSNWEDVTAYVQFPIAIRRGRQRPLDAVQPGTVSLMLDNRTGRFTPSAIYTPTSSTSGHDIIPNNRLRISVTHNGTVYYIFRGFVDDWTPTYPEMGMNALVPLVATDGFELLQYATVNSATLLLNQPGGVTVQDIASTSFAEQYSKYITELSGKGGYVTVSAVGTGNGVMYYYDGVSTTITLGISQASPQIGMPVVDITTIHYYGSTTFVGTFTIKTNSFLEERSDIRIGRLLNIVGWDANFMNIAAGRTNVGAMTASGETILQLIQQVADTEGGLFFASANGFLTFQNRYYRSEHTTPLGTFSDVAPNLPYQDVTFKFEKALIYNRVQVTRVGGTTQTSSRTTRARNSGLNFGQRTLSKSSLLMTADAEALSYAEVLQNQYAEPQLTVNTLTLQPVNDDLWVQVLSRDLSDRIRVTKGAITQDCHIESISHTIGKVVGDWKTVYTLSPALTASNSYWILEDSVYGVLGTTTRPGY